MRKFLTTLLLLVFFAPFAMHADEVIIGEGTDYDCSVPFNTLYTFSWNETIYPGSELGGACTINSIAFNCNAHDTIGTLNLTELDVYMGITQRETMSSTIDWTPASDLLLVYSGEDVVIGDNVWETINLDSPFYYTGEGNLVVVVAKKTNYQYISELKWFYTSVDNTTLYRRNDSSESIADEHPNGAAGTRLSYRPNIKLDVTYGQVESPVTVTPETIDLGYRPIGAWMRPENIEVTTEGDAATISSISSSNPFFVYTPVELPYELTTETPLTVKVSHLSTNNDGQIDGELLINHSFGSDAVALSAIAYNPTVSDVWEMPFVVSSYPFVQTPEYDDLYDNYMLPGDEEDGKDVVYRLSFQEETTLSAKVNGANGKVALYETHFNGKGGPDFDNYYGTEPNPDDPDDPTPDVLGESFSFNFNDGSLEGWKTKDADGDFRNWKMSGAGVPGIDGTNCIYSESWDMSSNSALTPDNYIYTDGLYTITENSVLSFYAKPLETGFYMEHYGVVVSTDGINFTTLWQHTVSVNEAANWTLQTVDLSSYAGRNVYVGLRHFNCSNEHAICIDNIELTSGDRSAKSNMIENLTVPAGVYYLVASATEEFTVSIFTETEDGNNAVSEVVAEIVDDNKAKAYWSWDFINTRLAFNSGKEIENDNEPSRGFSNYKVYRKNILTDGEATLVANNVTDTVYVDNTWGTATGGVYKYGVSVVYTNGETPIVWSNSIDKDMNVTLTVNVTTETGASAAGAKVTFVNTDDASYTYETTLGATASHTWNDFRLGTYDYTIELEGFKTSSATVEITQSTTIDCVLEEIFVLGDLYVSATGWAMWEDNASSFEVKLDGATVAEVSNNYYQFDVTGLTAGEEYTTTVIGTNTMEYTWTYASCDNFVDAKEYNVEVTADKNVELSWILPVQGTGETPTEFMYDFEDGTLNGFLTLDVNGDGRTWGNSTQFSSTDCGYESPNCAVSRSYDGMYDLSPDDYMVTTRKYAITENSKLRFYAAAENHLYAAEHYGVAISTTTNVSPSAFTTIWEETMIAKGNEVPRGERAPGQWYSKTVDLSAYAGQEVYIALRHFNCYGQFWIKIDDLTLTSNAKDGEEGDWIYYDNGEHYDAIGLNNGGTLKWGIMFPAESLLPYGGKVISKVSMYDKTSHDGNIYIYTGGTTSPANLIHTQPYVCTGAADYVEFELTEQIEITGNDNIWVVFGNNNGQFVASCTMGTGDPNGRWLSINGTEWTDVNEATGYDLTWQIRAFVEEPIEPNYTDMEVLGAMIYRDGELITEEPITEESFVDVNPGYGDFEYSLRVVFGGEEDSYYAMSCPQTETISIVRTCDAPRNLYGAETVQNGEIGVALEWPYTLHGSDWLYYDDAVAATGIGLGGQSFYWGIMFPKESLEFYGGTMMTKISAFEWEAHTGNLLIYYGGDNAPEMLVHTQPYVCNGSADFADIELTAPLPIDPSMNLWIVFNNENGNYPAAACNTTGDPNGRWISLDGSVWQDVVTAGQGLNYTWMIRAFVTSDLKSEIELPLEVIEQQTIENNNQSISSDVVFKADDRVRDNTFEHYNVYRGTSNDNYELIAEPTEGNYFDAVEVGTYYYKVTAVYTVDGEECESEPANAYGDDDTFIVVEVTSIDENGVSGMMIYPNPAKDFVKISTLSSQLSAVRIYNCLGMMVEEIEVNANEIEINTSDYSSGIYFIHIQTENGNITKKIIKD